MKRFAAVLFATLIFLAASSFAAARRPPGMEVIHNAPVAYAPHVEKLSDRYRLTLESNEPLPHYLIERSKHKIWFRLARPSMGGSQVLEGDSVIREIRLVARGYSADMILKLGDDAVSNDVYFDNGKKRLVVDVFTSRHVEKLAAAPELAPAALIETPAPKPVVEDARPATNPLKSRPPAYSAPASVILGANKNQSTQVLTVVVDAGHGGMDSGAIGTRGTLEKDINLEFAKDLAKYLAKEKNMRVIMTRGNDEFVPLGQRTEIANHAGADLFISIHCNASLSPRRNGLETYFLSPDATDKAAESVARLENSVVALEAQKGAPSSRLNELLASMAVGNYINESSKFATLICRNIRNRTSVDKTESKEADFFVLRGAQMPAVLIELEYLSNPVSELKLRSSRYRSQLVKAVTEGIKSYDRQARQEREALAVQSRQNVATR